jgi:hypothetical protein
VDLNTLYKEYKKQREMKISEDQYTFFVIFFPALLVIISDGIIDMEEWEYCEQLSQFMAKTFKEDCQEEADMESLSKAYLYEISYMIKHVADWKDDYLDALKGYLEKDPEAKSSVMETMLLFAEASDGTSDDEENQIEILKKQLAL